MPYYVYILYSAAIDQYYVGHTEDLNYRIIRHTNSGSKATKKANDWQLVYSEPVIHELRLTAGKWPQRREVRLLVSQIKIMY